MTDIPVAFVFVGKEYKGYFSQVNGSGSSMFHLNVGGYYWDRLRHSEFASTWCFDATPKTEELKKLAQEFVDLIIAWYQ